MRINYFLRGLIQEDMDVLFRWRNKDSIRTNMYHDQPISYEQHCQWIKNVLQNQSDYYRLFIHQNTPLGHISFKNINQQNQTCLWGFYIGEETGRAWQALGKVTYGPTAKEQKSMKFRRSIYITENLKSGDILATENLKIIRPGYGLAPKYYEQLLGKKVRKNIQAGTPMDWNIVQ
ncbi:hypothetical protein GN156_16240 [bacterium LRH843]|nr:hypothetical protein [bacterium LRH843]